jgi:HD superfamily phosphohydrolase
MPAPSDSEPTIEQLLDALARLYEGPELAAWEEEKPIYAHALPKLIEELRPTYTIKRPIKPGSTATVWELEDKKLGQRRALKLPRPRLSRIKSIVRIIRAESEKLASLNHQNIIKIYTADELTFSVGNDNYSFPYFIMEFLDGVQDLGDYVKNQGSNCPALALVEYFRGVLAGLEYLHTKPVDIVHCDIKPANILIAPNRPALITDFGYAKHFPRPGDPTQKTEVTFTLQYGHPGLVREIKDSSEKNATKAEIKREDLQVAFDLYAFGKTILEVLRTHATRSVSGDEDPTGFTAYQRRFVSIVAKRLLDGRVERVADDDLTSDMIQGLAGPVMDEIKYRSARDALADLEKLLDLYSVEGDVPELNPGIAKYIQIPHCRVPLTPRVEAVVNHPTFARLAQISQLGFVSMVYPGASHTRREHVLGTFAHCCDYVRALWHDERNPLFKCLLNGHDIEVLLAAALLHDIGQYPMSHDLAEISSDFSHERFNEQVLRVCPPGSNESLADLLHANWGVLVDELMDLWSANASSSLKSRLLNSIISGPLDCDKIDYVRRDSTHLGITFGLAVDHERLLRNITVACAPPRDGKVVPDRMDIVTVAVSEKALAVAESLVRSRKNLFTQVYWHRTVRSLKAMLGFVVRNTLLWLDNTDNAEQREEFWRAFHSEVLWLSANRREPERLGGNTGIAGVAPPGNEDWLSPMGGDEEGYPASALNASDDSLLLLFRRFAPLRERRVVDSIRARKLFKRVYVLTHSRETEAYNRIYGRFHTYRFEGKLKELEELRCNYECQIRNEVRAALETQRAVWGSRVQDIQDRIEQADPLILLDVPIKAVSPSIAKEAIHYMAERISGSESAEREFFASPVALEQVSFDKDVGKIRLFIPPEITDAILSIFSQMADHHSSLTQILYA